MEKDTKAKTIANIKFVICTILYSCLARYLFTRLGYTFLRFDVFKVFFPAGRSFLIYFGILVYSLYIHLKLGARKNFAYEMILALIPGSVFILCAHFTSLWGILVWTVIVLGVLVWNDIDDISCKELEAECLGKCLNYERVYRRIFRTFCVRMEIFWMVILMTYTAGVCWFLIKGDEPESAYSVETEVIETENLLELYKEDLRLFKSDNYKNLSEEERRRILQVVLDMELIYLGCEPMTVVIKEIENDGIIGVAGYCDYDGGNIVVDIETAEHNTEAMRTIFHEAYHVYQLACCYAVDLEKVDTRLKFYRDVVQWRKEYADYHDGSSAKNWEEFELYNEQEVEVSADAYAEERIWIYADFINNLEVDN